MIFPLGIGFVLFIFESISASNTSFMACPPAQIKKTVIIPSNKLIDAGAMIRKPINVAKLAIIQLPVLISSRYGFIKIFNEKEVNKLN